MQFACSGVFPVYSADQMRAYVDADRAASAPADSQPALEYVGNGMFKGETIQKAAEHWANWCDVRCMTGLSEFLRVVAARAQADSVTAPAVGYPPLPRVGAIGYASVVDIQIYAKTLTIGPHLPGVRDIALWTTDQMRAYVDADRAARAPADSVTAPVGGAAILKEILAAACCEDSETYLTNDQYRKLYDLQRRIESMPTQPTQAADSVLEDAARLLRQILAASQDGDSDTHLSAHFVRRIETITKAGGAA